MARGRMLSKSLSCSRRFNALTSEFAQLLYTMLLPHVDDFGRMTGDPFSVKLTVLPASPRSGDDFTAALAALHDSELIQVYQTGTDIWLQVNKFDDHQSGLHKRTESKIPAPDTTLPRKFPEIPGNSGSRARAELNLTELKGTEGKRTEQEQIQQHSNQKLVSSNGGSHTNEKAAPPARVLTVPKPKNGNGAPENLSVIRRVVNDVISKAKPPLEFASLKEDIKRACAKHRIEYDSNVVGTALTIQLRIHEKQRVQA